MFSLSNWLANPCAHPTRSARAVNAIRRGGGLEKKRPRQWRGQFDREEVNTMSDDAVHRSFTLHPKG